MIRYAHEETEILMGRDTSRHLQARYDNFSFEDSAQRYTGSQGEIMLVPT